LVVGAARAGKRNALDSSEPAGQECVGLLFDPPRHIGVGGAAVRWVVLEASVLRRVVRGRHHDPVGEPILAPAVVSQDRVGNDGCRRVAALRIDPDLDAVGREDFEGAGEGGLG
jgi:hypothetical protein